MKHTIFLSKFRALTVLSLISIVVFAVSLLKISSSSAQKLDPSELAPEAGTITGTVYADYNMNGARNTTGVAPDLAIDAGIAGVTVTAYDSAGVARGSAVSAANGTYTLNATGTGPYRLEFTTLPTGYFPSSFGSNNSSTIKFVPDGASSGNDLGIVLPTTYCQTNPQIFNNIFNIGPAAVDTIVRFPYNYTEELDGRLNSVDPTAWTTAPSRTSLLNPTGVIDADSVGATFGLTYDGRTRRLYSAAYLKRGANFGTLSSESTGAIYVTNDPAGSPSTSVYVNLNTVFGAGTAGANSHPISTTDFTTDSATPTLVGKRALGGLKIASNGANLYTVNLNDRRLYVIPTSGTLNSTTITRFDIPTTGLATSSGTCNSADVRPFAVGRDMSGQIYVGAVCSAESESDNTKVHAYVWRFTGAAFTLVANNTLTFNRFASGTNNATWLRWDNTSTGVLFRPSPMLTDIEFNGPNMILGFRDRYGDMTVLPDFNRGYGDIMRVCDVAGAFVFENNATCNGTTSFNPGSNDNSGNGGREFYTDQNGDGREEGCWGGLVQVPGYDHVVTTHYDPVTFNSSGTRVSNFYTGGVQRYSNTTGMMTGAYDVYLPDSSGGGNFGKANGGADSEVLCNAAPIEIGNRVWRDLNNNGVQDPGENGLANVTVRLYQGSTLIGTAVTNANGEYYFSSAAGTSTANAIYNLNLLFSTAYQVRFDNPANYNAGGPLFGLLLTRVNETSQAGDDDSSDSDATTVTNPSGSPAGAYPVISLTTGGPGANNHTFDVGFAAAPTAANVSVEGRVILSAGNGIRNAIIILTEADGTQHTAVTGSFGYYRFDEIESGQTVVVSIRSKRFTFNPSSRVISVTDSIADLDFIAEQ